MGFSRWVSVGGFQLVQPRRTVNMEYTLVEDKGSFCSGEIKLEGGVCACSEFHIYFFNVRKTGPKYSAHLNCSKREPKTVYKRHTTSRR